MDTLEKIDVLDAKVKTAVRLIVSLREEKITLLDRLEKILEERDSLFNQKEQLHKDNEQLLKEKDDFDSVLENLTSEKESVSILCEELKLKNENLKTELDSFKNKIDDLEKQSSEIVGDNSLIESGIQEAIDKLDEIERESGSFSPPVESEISSEEQSIQEAAESSFDGVGVEENEPQAQFEVAIEEENEQVQTQPSVENRAPLGEPTVDAAIEEVSFTENEEIAEEDDSPRELFDSNDTDDGNLENTNIESVTEEQSDKARELFRSSEEEVEEESAAEIEEESAAEIEEESAAETSSGTNSYYAPNLEEASVDVPIESVEPENTDSLDIF